MPEPTATEVHLLAEQVAQRIMLERLWADHLGRYDEPLEEADAIAEACLFLLDSPEASGGGAAHELVRQLAVGKMEESWARIRGQVAEGVEPGDLALGPRVRTPSERPPEASPPGEAGEPPVR